MPQLRRVLAPLAALWLLCQVGTVALVPVVLRGIPAPAHGTECTCGHGDGLMCPMHHHQAAGVSTRCSMQPENHISTAVLTALAGIAGFIAQPSRSIQLPVSVEQAPAAATPLIGQQPVPPDPPPPRG